MSDDGSFYSISDSDLSFKSTEDSVTESVSLNMFIAQQLTNSHKHFNVCHINAQSLPHHFSELLDIFTDTIHAILISETWLKPSLLSTSFSIPGFVLLRNDRLGNRGGGVAIYLRCGIPYKVIASSPSIASGSLEYLFVEVLLNGNKIILGVVYSPPSVNYFHDLESAIMNIASEYAHHIIMGDFNTDLLQNSSRSRELRMIMNSVNFSILPLGPTHSNINTADSWLDLIIVSSTEHVVNHGQFPASGFSRHDFLFITYRVKSPKVTAPVLRLRSFATLDMELLKRKAASIDWSDIFNTSDVNHMVETLTNNILQLYDAVAPIRNVKVKRPPAPWMDSNIRKAMAKRDRAFVRFKNNRCDANWNVYKATRNRCNQMVRAAKRRHIHKNIISSSPAGTWKFLNSLGLGRLKNCPDMGSISLNDLNKHFSSATNVDNSIKHRTISLISSLPKIDANCFAFSPITDEDVRKIIFSIKSKATGYDDVSRNMIIPILDNILPIITHIINFSFSTGVFPSFWRKAFVLPLAKLNNPSSVNHFRPISILPFLSKTLESAAYKQLSSYIYKNNLLSPLQSGFRPGHSTTTALLKVLDDVREGMEESKLTVLVLIDFSNAFCTVDHDILLAICKYMGFSSSVLDWLSTYLRGRQQRVKVNQQSFSDWSDLTTGVPQGGILSPLLFSIFINLITVNFKCSYHLYADDLQLYARIDPAEVNSAIEILNLDLEAICDWCRNYGIAVNPVKCQAIILGSPRRIAKLDFNSLEPIVYNSTIIPLSQVVKDLGLMIDANLSWRSQVAEISRRVTITLRGLYRFKNFLPTETKAMLVRVLVLPLIDCADVCYSDVSQLLLCKLDRLLNNCIRFIFGLRKYDHVSIYRSKLKWLPIHQRRCIKILRTLFSILYDPCTPQYLKCKFQYLGSSHDRNLRSSEGTTLCVFPRRTKFMSQSFAAEAIRLWNKLPPHIRKPTSVATFKRMVTDHYLSSSSK